MKAELINQPASAPWEFLKALRGLEDHQKEAALCYALGFLYASAKYPDIATKALSDAGQGWAVKTQTEP